jgi:Acetyltransferase (GNAT) family
VGTAALRQIGPETAEIKRMWIASSHRRARAGRAMLRHLIAAARNAGYGRIRLDSPDFTTSAHALYRSRGFLDTGPIRKAKYQIRISRTGHSWSARFADSRPLAQFCRKPGRPRQHGAQTPLATRCD